MSLMEVNEASCVIQEAAHEDANIIFGAVVDPQLTGKLKITVIATGFDRKAAGRSAPAAALQTPVDLSNYTAHFNAAAASSPETAPDRLHQPGSGFAPAPLTVNRRPALELSLPLPVRDASGNGSPDEHSLDLDSPLDVPAFLRRQS